VGIFGHITTEPRANALFRLYLALPFLPPKQFIPRLRVMVQDIRTLPAQCRPGFAKFHRYVYNYWVKQVRPERISVFDRARRTNNALEGIHSTMAKRIAVHGNIFKLIHDLDVQIWKPTEAKLKAPPVAVGANAQSRGQRLCERKSNG
jgi:hypothetical protein